MEKDCPLGSNESYIILVTVYTQHKRQKSRQELKEHGEESPSMQFGVKVLVCKAMMMMMMICPRLDSFAIISTYFSSLLGACAVSRKNCPDSPEKSILVLGTVVSVNTNS
jgi:hypothetical protein